MQIQRFKLYLFEKNVKNDEKLFFDGSSNYEWLHLKIEMSKLLFEIIRAAVIWTVVISTVVIWTTVIFKVVIESSII